MTATAVSDGRRAASTRAMPPASASDVLAAVAAVGPELRTRADEIEAGRRLPADLVDTLSGAGCFRLLQPASHGGIESDLASAMQVVEALASADASVGWTVMIGGAAWCDLALLPRATFDALFAVDGDMITAGAFNPTGGIRPTAGGYRVTGRWGFASGCQHATWIYGNCIESVEGGEPRLRAAVFDPRRVEIEDTWRAVGLCGTGSHHFRADDVEVAADWTFAPLEDEPCVDATVVRIPPPTLLSLLVATVATGNAFGALDDAVDLAAERVPIFAHGPLAGDPTFHTELAVAETQLSAARALLRELADEAWATAADGQPLSLSLRARARAAATWATARAVETVEAAYRSGGGTSVFSSSPLQRRIRDAHAITQHFLVRRDVLPTAGAIRAGQDVEVMVF